MGIKVKATFGNREFFGTIQKVWKNGSKETIVINIHLKQANGEWVWAGRLGKVCTSLEFDKSEVEIIEDFPI